MADRVRITSDSRRRPPRVKVDVIVLVVLVLTALTLAPGHGLWDGLWPWSPECSWAS